jgi:hypothetical protein
MNSAPDGRFNFLEGNLQLVDHFLWWHVLYPLFKVTIPFHHTRIKIFITDCFFMLSVLQLQQMERGIKPRKRRACTIYGSEPTVLVSDIGCDDLTPI